MELQTVKLCFEKYINYLSEFEKIHTPENLNINDLSIIDMDKLTQILFMDYVIKCDTKVNLTSISCILYKHINSLIRQYIQDEVNKTIIINNDIKDHILKLTDDNIKLKNELNTKHDIIKTNNNATSKGWFY